MKKVALLTFVFLSSGAFGIEKEKTTNRAPADWSNLRWDFKEKEVKGGRIVCGLAYIPGYAGLEDLRSNSATSTSCVFVPDGR